MFKALLFLVALGLAAYTQFTQLTAVPGLHFDEAWQGVFAHRIASEAGFYPMSAMNSYTSPVVHYLLALAFKLFGPSLVVMRGTYAFFNFATLGLILVLFWRAKEKKAAFWFVLLWALLPLSVHDHRFYVEMTGLFGLCLAFVLWGLALWHKRPILSFTLTLIAIIAGSYSHVLFVAVFIGALYIGARYFSREFYNPRARALVATTALALTPLALRMGWGLKKPLPFVLATAFVLLAAFAALSSRHRTLNKIWERLPRVSIRSARWLALAAIPFLVGFLALMWNGNWPYAQATGHLEWRWLPLNAALFVVLAFYKRKKDGDFTSMLWHGFLVTFLVSSLLILKQSPRYYYVPLVLAMMWMALKLAHLRTPAFQWTLALTFTVWNLWCFQTAYITRFENYGSTTNEFRAALYHDNGRDFRPFQKAFSWLVSQNCQNDLRWFEDDRFLFPVEFLRLTAPKPTAPCAWPYDSIFFSHIENYDPLFQGPRTARNTPPPANAPHVKLLAHFAEWGDLAFWIRKTEK